MDKVARNLILGLLGILMLIAFGAVSGSSYAQKNKQKAGTQKEDPYKRPKLRQPIKPTIPSANRYRGDIVFLEQADSLFRPGTAEEEMQIVKGNVRFRQAGMWMYCDSAYYYPIRNSLDAFGHVKMQQGDTLFVYADKLFYDGFSRFAKLRCGPSQSKVKMENRDVVLTTDSLDYDINSDLGWYADGGRLEDNRNILTSVYGNYSPTTKDADFYHDVLLRSKDGKYRLISDTLYYNTDTHIARIETMTEIQGPNDTIYTSHGLYNTDTGVARLLTRSLITHRDSLNRVTTLEGDSIDYDPVTRITRAYSYRDPNKLASPMVIQDTARKATLIGGFGLYNDSTREAWAAEYPLMIEYSRPDSLFLRADTIRTWMVPKTVSRRDSTGTYTDTIPGEELHVARAYARARFFRKDIQGVADTITFTEADSLLKLTRLPVVWSDERQMRGDTIIVHFNDSTADRVTLPHKGFMMELVEEDFFNQLSADKMRIYLDDGNLRRLESEGSVMTIFLPQEKDSTYNKLVYAESSYLNIDMDKGNLDRLKMWPEVTGTVTPIFLVKQAQKLLPKAEWLVTLRPRREWYGNTLRWADDLGEIPDDLEKYFERKQ